MNFLASPHSNLNAKYTLGVYYNLETDYVYIYLRFAPYFLRFLISIVSSLASTGTVPIDFESLSTEIDPQSTKTNLWIIKILFCRLQKLSRKLPCLNIFK